MKGTAVLWIRLSSEPQSHGYSPDSQARLLEDAAKEYDVRQTFSVTESAKIAENRKRFKEMVEAVRANHIEHLFAWSHDRLARHYEDFATLQSLVDKHDVSIHLVESNKVISRESPITDRFMFQVLPHWPSLRIGNEPPTLDAAWSRRHGPVVCLTSYPSAISMWLIPRTRIPIRQSAGGLSSLTPIVRL